MIAAAGRFLELSLSLSFVLLPLAVLSPQIQRRYTARSLYLVWLLLAVRLLLPVGGEGKEKGVTITVPGIADTSLIAVLPEPAPKESSPTSGGGMPGAEDVKPPVVTLGQIVAAGWWAGALGILLWNGAGYLLASRRLLASSREEEEDQRALAQLWGVGGRRPAVLRSTKTDGPLSLGLIHPVIVLPEALTESGEREMVLRHELGHILHHDLWYKALLILVHAVHWFNPLVWVMCRQARKNLEYCCDDWVIRGRGADFRHQYGKVLLRYAARSTGEALPMAPLSSGGREMKGRIMNLFSRKKSGGPLVCLVLAGTLLIGPAVSFEVAQAQGRALTVREALDALEEGCTLNAQELTITIPANYMSAENWMLQVSGRYVGEGGMSMSIHIVDHDGTRGRWRAGETYRYSMDGFDLSGFVELSLYAYLPDIAGKMAEKRVDLLAIAEDREGLQPQEKAASDWQWPLPGYDEITAYYGTRVHPISGRKASHDGVDIYAPEGSGVLAVRSGTVSEAGCDPTDGNYVVLSHEGGVSSRYCHLRESQVEVGSAVAQGERIGTVGKTGAATGPHLHLEFAGPDGTAFDPLRLFDSAGEEAAAE